MQWKKGPNGVLQLVLNHISITIKQSSNKKRITVRMTFPKYTKYFNEEVSIDEIKEWGEDWAWEVLDGAMVLFEDDEETT